MPSDEVEKALKLIESINSPNANLDQIKRALISLVGQVGAGAYGDRGARRNQMIAALRDDHGLKTGW